MTFEYDGIQIHYEIFEEKKIEAGKQETKKEQQKNGTSSARPLLLLHGWMAKIEAMAPIYQYFQKTRKVIGVDFPGQGGSSDTLKEAWGVPEYAAMVKSLIQKLGIEGCDVIGHSFGGRVIIYLSSQEPELFHKIILTDAAGVKSKRSLKKSLKIYSYKISKAFLRLVLPKEKYEKKLEEIRKKKGSSDYAALTSDVMRETFQRVIHLDLTPNLKKIKQPTLLIWGENDKDTPLYMAKIMEREIPDSGIALLEGAGHFSYLDQPQKYLVIANEFLKEAR